MEGIEFLLLKWDNMNNKQRAFVLILGLGAISFALDQILGFISKWIVPNISQAQTALHNQSISIISFSSILSLVLVLLFTYITLKLAERERYNAEKESVKERNKAEQEISDLVKLSKKLIIQLGKDNKEKQIQRGSVPELL